MRIVLTIAALLALGQPNASAQPAAAPTPEPEGQPQGNSRLDAAVEQIVRGVEQLKGIAEEDRKRINALERRIQSLTGGAPGVSPGASNAELAELRSQVEELQTALEDAETSREELGDSLFEQLARRMSLSGYTTFYFRTGEDEVSHFHALRSNLLLSSQVSSNLRFYGELEFEETSHLGEHEGEGGTIAVEQAFVDLTHSRALTIRAGVLLVPFGYYNRYHEDWRFPFSERPLMNHYVFPSTYSDPGIMLRGTPYAGSKVQLSYELSLSNGLTDEIVTEIEGTGFRHARPAYEEDNNEGKSLTGRLELLVNHPFIFGVSGHWGPYDEDGNAVAMLGADILLKWKRFSLRAEGVYVKIDPGSRLIDDDEDPMTPEVESPFPTSMAGAMVESELQFWPSALKKTWLGSFDDPVLFLAARLDAARLDFDATRSAFQFSGSVGYRPVHRSAILLEYSRGKGDFALGDGWQASFFVCIGF